MSFTASALLVSWAAIALLAFALAGVLGRVHRLERQVSGVAAPSPVGQPFAVGQAGAGPLLALFVDEGCGSCDRAAAAVAPLADRGAGRVFWRREEPDAFAAHAVSTTPYALVVDHEHRVVAALAVGSAERMDEALAALATLEGR